MGDLKRDIIKLNKKYYKDDAILGKALMTLANKLNSSRANMFAGESEQAVVLLNPDFPGVYTNYENLIGKYSSAYKKLEDDYTIIDKIVKYPYKDSTYTLILQNNRTKKYDVLEKKHGERITETFGYKYNTEVMDSLEKGDFIEKGSILYRSTSFDDEMNYRQGLNVPVIYLSDPMNIEDGIIIDKWLQKRLTHIEYDIVTISINDNDIFLKMNGKEIDYKAFPDIGEYVKDAILAVTRRIDYSRAFYDLKNENIIKELSSDTPFYLPFTKDRIVDINIYCNKDSIDEVPDTPYNEQLKRYLKDQNKYYSTIAEKLEKIISKEKYSDDLATMYVRSSRIINPEYKWQDVNKKIFGNIKIEFKVEKYVDAVVGSKLCKKSAEIKFF